MELDDKQTVLLSILCSYSFVIELTPSTHSGVKSNFTEHFIKTGRIEKHYGKMYSQLFSWRQKGNYGDLFHFDQQMVIPYMESVQRLISIIQQMIEDN